MRSSKATKTEFCKVGGIHYDLIEIKKIYVTFGCNIIQYFLYISISKNLIEKIVVYKIIMLCMFLKRH